MVKRIAPPILAAAAVAVAAGIYLGRAIDRAVHLSR